METSSYSFFNLINILWSFLAQCSFILLFGLINLLFSKSHEHEIRWFLRIGPQITIIIQSTYIIWHCPCRNFSYSNNEIFFVTTTFLLFLRELFILSMPTSDITMSQTIYLMQAMHVSGSKRLQVFQYLNTKLCLHYRLFWVSSIKINYLYYKVLLATASQFDEFG